MTAFPCHLPPAKLRLRLAAWPPLLLLALLPLAGGTSVAAQSIDCDAQARAYADSYLGRGNRDLDILDGAMGGAVAGGEWRGDSGARRGARAGAALEVLDNLATYPGGWQGLYDMAYQECMRRNSPVEHRPRSLGDPAYRPPLARPAYPPVPARPPAPLEPAMPRAGD
ncbi:hypothetical protein GCM10011316_35250 [Roseibium aquae]|uniref:Uncharacterized protein n=1 Tax=Roseibium aquae TaxID=1323746 RepID=A0A916TNK9_9HYPH|nr:hypothetical protein [Roseibium aquae]GGB60162.1 hypothetical protein GCM10011316_35250 [Roseibium aquae]